MTRILVIEDNADLRALLEEVLAEAGYEVRGATDGADALQVAAPWSPDAFVLDLMMPGMDGPAFLRARARVPALAAVPALVLTAHPYHHRVLDGLDVTAVLRKLYDVDDLLAAIAALCRGETGRGHAS